MGFLAPWFLAGAVAVGLPLWIHLLRQYRSTPHLFSSQVRYLTQATDDPAALKAAIQSVQAGDERSSFGEFARALRTLAADAKGPLEVHFFSDMQKSSMPPAFADLALGSGTNLILHTVADSKEPNWLVESVTAPGRIYDPKKVRVQAVIAGMGTETPSRKSVSLVLDNRVLETKQI